MVPCNMLVVGQKGGCFGCINFTQVEHASDDIFSNTEGTITAIGVTGDLSMKPIILCGELQYV